MGQSSRTEDHNRSEPPIAWVGLGDEEQTRLRIAYGHHLDSLPPTCCLDTKIERFRRWLADQGVDYRG